jgi:predicted nuclease of predicted toxin-antitoxin system
LTSKPPELPTLFLDESLDSASVVTALENAGAKIKRATKLFPRGTADEIWLEEAGKHDWIVLTRDKRIRYRQLERQSLQQAGVRTFVFIGGNVTMKDTAAILVKALPKIIAISAADAGPFIYHIGLGRKPVKMK